jgi:uncharacterized coiled-coil protein SlyX
MSCPPDVPALADRLTDLEIRLAYQDRVIAALDDVVRAFTVRVEALELALAQLHTSVNSPTPPAGPANDPPPHY